MWGMPIGSNVIFQMWHSYFRFLIYERYDPQETLMCIEWIFWNVCFARDLNIFSSSPIRITVVHNTFDHAILVSWILGKVKYIHWHIWMIRFGNQVSPLGIHTMVQISVLMQLFLREKWNRLMYSLVPCLLIYLWRTVNSIHYSSIYTRFSCIESVNLKTRF
jgi:hypothetical protein